MKCDSSNVLLPVEYILFRADIPLARDHGTLKSGDVMYRFPRSPVTRPPRAQVQGLVQVALIFLVCPGA